MDETDIKVRGDGGANTASATLEGIEDANRIRKGQMTPGLCPFVQFAALAA
jgi:putative transposase